MGSVIPIITIISVIIASCYGNNKTASVRHKNNMFAIKQTTTLKDFGDLTYKMVEAMTRDGDAKEIDLEGVTQLVSALSRASVFVDHPQVCFCYIRFYKFIVNIML